MSVLDFPRQYSSPIVAGAAVAQALSPSLHAAAERGYGEVVEALARRMSAAELHVRDSRGRTSLLAAARAGHARAVGALLRARARADVIDEVRTRAEDASELAHS